MRVSAMMRPDRVRNLMLRKAVMTSLAGKGVTVFTQLLAIPLAITALGLDRYGAYAMLTAVFLWCMTASTVIASALTLELASAHAAGDWKRESRLFSSAFFFGLAAALLLWAGFQVLLTVIPLDRLFGLDKPIFLSDLEYSARVITWLLPATVLVSVGEAVHAGYQRQYVNNLLQIGANAATLMALLIVVRFAPSITNIVLAMFLPAAVAKAVNLLLVWHTWRHLLPHPRNAALATLAGLLTLGAAFALTQVGSFLYLQFPTFNVGRHAGPATAAYLSTMMMVIAISGNLLVTFTQPLVPALRDSVARGDFAWVLRTHALTLRRLVPYISMAALVIAVGGSFFVSQLTRHSVQFDVATQCLWAAFFWLVAWEHVHYTFLAGLGRVWAAALIYTVGACVMLVFSWFLVPVYGLLGAFSAMCLGPLLCTAMVLPWLLRRTLSTPDPR
jgi:O-antigen/teichoic acid export membrane protein